MWPAPWRARSPPPGWRRSAMTPRACRCTAWPSVRPVVARPVEPWLSPSRRAWAGVTVPTTVRFDTGSHDRTETFWNSSDDVNRVLSRRRSSPYSTTTGVGHLSLSEPQLRAVDRPLAPGAEGDLVEEGEVRRRLDEVGELDVQRVDRRPEAVLAGDLAHDVGVRLVLERAHTCGSRQAMTLVERGHHQLGGVGTFDALVRPDADDLAIEHRQHPVRTGEGDLDHVGRRRRRCRR